MKLRWALWLVLLLSVGVNLGVLFTLRRGPSLAVPDGTANERVPVEATAPPAQQPAVEQPESRPPETQAPSRPAVTVAPRPKPAVVPPPGQTAPAQPLPSDAAQPSATAPIEPAPDAAALPPRFDRVADALQLRPEQRQPFIDLQRRHFEAVRLRRIELNDARRLLSREFLSGAADEGRVRVRLAEVQRLQRGLDDELARLLLDAQSVLDETQQSRFAELVLQHLRSGPPQRPGAGNRRGNPPRRGGTGPMRQRP